MHHCVLYHCHIRTIPGLWQLYTCPEAENVSWPLCTEWKNGNSFYQQTILEKVVIVTLWPSLPFADTQCSWKLLLLQPNWAQGLLVKGYPESTTVCTFTSCSPPISSHNTWGISATAPRTMLGPTFVWASCQSSIPTDFRCSSPLHCREFWRADMAASRQSAWMSAPT